MKHAIALHLALILVLLSARAASQATPPVQPDSDESTPAQPAEDDPRRGVPTREWREALPEDQGVSDRALEPGAWRGWLALPSGHELAISMYIDFDRDYFRDPIYSVRLVNGTEFTDAAIEAIQGEGVNTRVLITFEGSTARIEADSLSGGRKLYGEYIYERQTDEGPIEFRLPFTAAKGDGRRYDTPDPLEPELPAVLPERWSVTFESRQGPGVMVVRLLPDGRHVQGTVSTPTGDDGVLFGVVHEGRLRLSRFTGGGGILYDGTIQADGSLIGTFHSLAHHSETFTATPSRDAALPDLFEQTRWLDGVSPAELTFRDLDGVERSLGELAPGPALLYVFGTWCHNCADATRYLRQLHAEHGDALNIVGLAFESPADFEQQAERVRRYAERRDVPFPLLIAGDRDKSSATESLGALDRVRAYPTFVFVNAQGEVTGVHQGFIGPADPEQNAQLRAAFESRIDAMLAEG